MTSPIQLLIADPAPVVRAGLRVILQSEASMEVAGEPASCDELAAACASENLGVVILDPDLPGRGLWDLVSDTSRRAAPVRWLLWTQEFPRRTVEIARQAGVTGFVPKSAPPEDLLRAVKDVHAGHFCHLAGGESKPLGWNHDGTRSPLAPREIEVLQRTLQGHSRKQIAGELGIQIKTVDVYRHNIMEKLRLDNTIQLVLYGVRSGLISLHDPETGERQRL